MSGAVEGIEGTARRVWWGALVLLAIMGVTWSLGTPVGDGPDEPSHVVKAAAVVRGELQTSFQRRRTIFDGTIPWTTVTVPRAYGELEGRNRCFRGTLSEPAACASRISGDRRPGPVDTYVGTYPPTYYALVGWPSLLAGPRTSTYLMRVVSSLLVAAALATAAGSLVRAGATGAGLGLAALGVTPAVLYLAGSVNPSALELALACCAWASLLELGSRGSPVATRAVVRVVVATVLLGAARPLGPAFVVTVVALVALALGPSSWTALARDARVRLAGAAVLLATFASAGYVALARAYEVIEYPVPAGTGRLDLARAQLEAAPRLQGQSVGLLSWVGPAEVWVPRPLVLAWLALVLLVAVAALVVGSPWSRAALALTMLGSVALPPAVGFVAVTGSWQGRYTLPLSVGVPLLSAWVLGRLAPRRVVAPLGVGAAVVVAVGWALAFERRTTRTLVGLPNAVFTGVRGGRWDGPVPAWSLYVVVAVGCVALPLGVAWLARADRGVSGVGPERRSD